MPCFSVNYFCSHWVIKISKMPQRRLIAVLAVFVSVASLSAAQTQVPTLRSQSNVVLAPTLVIKKSGEIVHGLSTKDFILEDNGMEQEIRLDDTPDAEPISLVVAVQNGGSANLQFDSTSDQPSALDNPNRERRKSSNASLNGLGTMVEGFLGETKSEVAVVTFDNRVALFQDFTEDVPATAKKLRELKGSGHYGAAILDAVSYSLDLLERRPKGRTRVLLLISENLDHGSVSKLDQVVQRVTLSNTLIYSVAFSPLRAEVVRDLKGQNPEPANVGRDPNYHQPTATIDLPKMLFMATNAMRKNTARAIANLSGGEYSTFKNKRTFDGNLVALTNHVRNRYLLSFQPKNPQPGLHLISVRLRVPQRDIIVLARNSYWVSAVVAGEIPSR